MFKLLITNIDMTTSNAYFSANFVQLDMFHVRYSLKITKLSFIIHSVLSILLSNGKQFCYFKRIYDVRLA